MSTIRSEVASYYTNLHADAAAVLSAASAALRSMPRDSSYGELRKAFAAVESASRRENDARIRATGARHLAAA